MIVTVFLDCFDLDKETGIIITISAEQKTPLANLLTFSQLTQFLTTTDHILRHNLMATKQLYRVRFQRNCGVLKKARCQQVEVRKLHYTVIMPCHIMQLKSTGAPFIVILLEAAGAHHVFIYVQSLQSEETWKGPHWVQGYFHSSRTEGCQPNHVCCHLQ